MDTILDSASYTFRPHALPQLVAGLMALGWTLVVLIQERASRVSALLFLLGLCIGGSFLVTAVEWCAVSDDVALWWLKTDYTILALAPGAMYHFAMAVLRLERNHRRSIRAVWAASVVLMLPAHGTETMVPAVKRFWWGYASATSWLSTLMLGFVFATMLVTLWYYYRGYRRAAPGSVHRRRVKAYLWAAGTGVFAMVDFLAELGLDIYPVGFVFVALFVLLAARATWRYRLVDLTPAFAAGQVLETMQGAVVVTDEEDSVKLVNRATCELLGFEEWELRGKDAAEIMVEEWAHEARGSLASRDLHLKWRDRDGELWDVSMSASALRDRDSRPVGTVYVAMDISVLRRKQEELAALNRSLEQQVRQRSAALRQRAAELEQEVCERRRAEEALREAYEELKVTQQQLLRSGKMAAVGQLAAGVAHEINNPAGFVLSNLETMQEYAREVLEQLVEQERLGAAAAEDDGQWDALLRHMERAGQDEELLLIQQDCPEVMAESLQGADRIREIVSSLKTYAHPGDVVPRPVDVNLELERALTLTHNELKFHCEVVRQLEPLPPVMGHAGELGQVFVNLLVNASQAMNRQGKVSVRTKKTSGGDRVRVEIEDDGAGMPPQVAVRVFEPFFTTKEVGQGTGLGLSIVYGIIQRHGGDISVRSAQGRGTTFTIDLPAEADHFSV